MSFRHPLLERMVLPRDIFEKLEVLTSFFKLHLDEERKEAYGYAVVQLEQVAYLIAHAGVHVEIGMLLFWPYTVSDVVMNDIHAANPHACVLLCHFAVLLSVLEKHFWFLNGWTGGLFSSSMAHLAGHVELLEVVEWTQHWVMGMCSIPTAVGT